MSKSHRSGPVAPAFSSIADETLGSVESNYKQVAITVDAMPRNGLKKRIYQGEQGAPLIPSQLALLMVRDRFYIHALLFFRYAHLRCARSWCFSAMSRRR